MNANEVLEVSPVIPVVVLHDVAHAVPTAQALVDGGIGIIEVTLRTQAALGAIEQIAIQVPDIVIGAGTVITPEQVNLAIKSGAQFLVTPGCTGSLLDALEDSGKPFLPGAATLSEALQLAERGHQALKFFPAESSGGVGFLKAVHGPLPDLRFCPTGGINPSNAASYLTLSNVSCVGGSWLTPSQALVEKNWFQITQLAQQACVLKP